jgi:hypothetical protein
VITSLAALGGLAWHEQFATAKISFKPHVIMGSRKENNCGLVFSELPRSTSWTWTATV